MRIAAFYTHPIQYFAPLFREIAASGLFDLTVFYSSRQGVEPYRDAGFQRTFQWDIPLLEGYRSCFLPGWGPKAEIKGFFQPFNPALLGELRRGKFDALWVHSYMYANHWLAFLAARATGTPLWLRGESHEIEPRRAAVRLVKKLAVGRAARAARACLYIGSHNRSFYRKYGVAEEKLFPVPYTVDNRFFQRQAAGLAGKRAELRSAWDLPDRGPVFLFVGKLAPYKQPLLLLEAYRRVRRERPCALLLAGDGELRGEIEARVRAQEIPDVRITGFLNQSAIGRAYAAGDVLALPSAHEPWGLVVNEAMNFGLAVVASDRVGCAPDLVKAGENGQVFPYHSVQALADRLMELAAGPDLVEAFGRRSRELIEGWGLPQTVQGLGQAARALERGAS